MDTIKDKKGITVAININWCIEDVLETAKNEHIKLTRKQAGEVLDKCLADHDATIGVNWDVISYHIGCVKND